MSTNTARKTSFNYQFTADIYFFPLKFTADIYHPIMLKKNPLTSFPFKKFPFPYQCRIQREGHQYQRKRLVEECTGASMSASGTP